MRELLEGVELDGIPLFPPYFDDDVADRLSHRQTTSLLAMFALVVVMMEFVGEPINCWAPAHFKKPQEQYADRWSKPPFYFRLGHVTFNRAKVKRRLFIGRH